MNGNPTHDPANLKPATKIAGHRGAPIIVPAMSSMLITENSRALCSGEVNVVNKPRVEELYPAPSPYTMTPVTSVLYSASEKYFLLTNDHEGR